MASSSSWVSSCIFEVMGGSIEARALVLIERIYASALDATTWKDTIAAICAELGVPAGGLRNEHRDVPALQQTWVGLDPAFERAYVEQFWQDDPWVPAAATSELGVVLNGNAHAGPGVLARNAFYNDLCIPFGLDDVDAVVLSRSDAALVTFSVMHEKSRPLDENAKQLFSLLCPHIRRAAVIERTIASSGVREEASWQVLDRLALGVFVLDGRGGVLRMNPAAERMLGDGLVIERRALRAVDRHARRELARLVATSAQLCPDTPVSAVLVPRPSGQSPFVATLVPLAPRFSEARYGSAATLMCLVSDPAVRPEPPVERLVALYGLTRAEAQVAVLVGRGCVPKEAAATLGTSYDTVRSHLARVFAKTGARSQAELVALLLQLGMAS